MVRIGVIGVGHLGSHHARILSETSEAELIGVVDINSDRGNQVASQYQTRFFPSLEELLPQIHAATIAVPTYDHYDVARSCLREGCHVLIEKPITSTTEQAEELIDLAEKSDLVLQVGHLERYNPAFVELKKQVVEPEFIEIHRLGRFSARSLDIDVILDLMIHDLDIVIDLVDPSIERLDAVGVAVLSEKIDIANTRLVFANGCVANLTASRISREQMRKLRIFQHNAYFSLDYEAQHLEIYHLRSKNAQPTITRETPDIPKDEPLRRELQSFLGCIESGRMPEVSGTEGRRALEIALQIVETMRQKPSRA